MQADVHLNYTCAIGWRATKNCDVFGSVAVVLPVTFLPEAGQPMHGAQLHIWPMVGNQTPATGCFELQELRSLITGPWMRTISCPVTPQCLKGCRASASARMA